MCLVRHLTAFWNFADYHLETCYVYKYAELKDGNYEYPWVVRQTGVYHQYDNKLNRSVWVIVSPMQKSQAAKRIKQCLESKTTRIQIIARPLLLHSVLISANLSNWRGFCEHYESKLEAIVSSKYPLQPPSTEHTTVPDSCNHWTRFFAVFEPCHTQTC